MADEQAGAAPGHLVVLLVDIILGDGVKGGSGLIQHKNRRVFIQGTGQHQALGLATGELHAVQIDIPAHMGLDTRREGCDFFRQPCLVKTVPHLFLVDAVHGLGHILGHRAGEHAEILKDRFKQLVVIPAVILPDILPVQQNTPPGGVKEAADQLDQCRLASAIQAHDG